MAAFPAGAELTLARRIEAGHAHSGMASAAPHAIEQIAGGWAVFQGSGSPLTQAVGIGLKGAVKASELDRLEAFFHDRGSESVIDLCPLGDPALLDQLIQRGYTTREANSVLIRRIDSRVSPPSIEIQPVVRRGNQEWARIVIQGFTGIENPPAHMVAMVSQQHSCRDAFFGLQGNRRAAAAALETHKSVATFYGDVTLPFARCKGIQSQMISYRLNRAYDLGCDLASAAVSPGSSSHRNYERAGFHLLYTRVMLARS